MCLVCREDGGNLTLMRVPAGDRWRDVWLHEKCLPRTRAERQALYEKLTEVAGGHV